MAKGRPNVLLIMTDQWRGDCLSIAGHPAVHTPWLDQLALDGVRFSRAYCSSPSCIAARAALMTGLTPRSHGRVGYQDGVAWRYPVTLAGEFTRHGYRTHAVGKMHVYPERNKVGFQSVVLHDGPLHFSRRTHPGLKGLDDYLPWLEKALGRKADYFDHGVHCNSNVARPWDKPEFTHPTNFVTMKAVEFLRKHDRKKPFFLFVSYHRPHPPYDPPEWAFEQYLYDEMPEVPVGDWADIAYLHELTGNDFGDNPWLNRHRPDTMWGRIPERRLRRARAGYWGHMTHIDHQVNFLLENLHDYGLDADTLVCFTSDHGEMLGDHNFFRKSLPYEGSARVPLILRGPEGSGIGRNIVVDRVAELRDLMPTCLDWAGLPIKPSIEGRSLLPLARGESSPVHEYIQGEHIALNQSVQWLTDGREKYVWFSGTGKEQLFDLAADPQELRDLVKSGEAGARASAWRERLAGELAGREEGYSDGRTLVPGRPPKRSLSILKTFKPRRR